jgi:hypothetical protein
LWHSLFRVRSHFSLLYWCEIHARVYRIRLITWRV